jgi:hypothetical protein
MFRACERFTLLPSPVVETARHRTRPAGNRDQYGAIAAGCSFFLLYPALNSVAASDLVFARTGAHKLFNLVRSNECSPKGSTRHITGRARFTHQPVMIFSKHGVAAIGTEIFMRGKADK